MSMSLNSQLLVYGTISLLMTCSISTAASSSPAQLEIESGAATFEAATNVAGIEVKGKSNLLTGHLELAREAQEVLLQHIDVSLPVKSLATGMKVRDEHMRKYIFTTADSQLPDIQFTSDRIVCPVAPGAQDFTCRVAGDLSIRGVPRPFTMSLNIKEQSSSAPAFRAAGDATVRLSDYAIVAPSQFGVTASNEVKLHLDFSARPKAAARASAGGPR